MISGSELADEVRARLADAKAAAKAARAGSPGEQFMQSEHGYTVQTLESLVAWIDEKEAEAESQMEQTMGLVSDDI